MLLRREVNFDRKESVSMSHRALKNAQQPLLELVGLTRFELVTPRLSSVCSNQLSYRPQSPVSRLRWPCQLRRGSPALADQPSRRLVRNTRRRPVLSKLDRRASFRQPCEYQIDLEKAFRFRLPTFGLPRQSEAPSFSDTLERR